jgi:hypothetical protein
MVRFPACAVLAAFVVFAPPARSGGYEAGLEAFATADFATALELWRPLAEAGDPRAQTELGVMYGLGYGVERNDAIAALWFRLAAIQGYPRAQNNLGRLYRLGLGVKQDPEAGARWIKRAARAGEVRAQGTLGALYARGEGVPRDLLRAYFWWSVAARHGHFESIVAREDAAYMMTPRQIRTGNALAEDWVREPESIGP